MAMRAAPFLMFQGDAEEAITWYASLFDNAQVLELTRYGAVAAGAEGTVQRASFSLAGQVFLCTDSVVPHEFGFTPSFSIWVETANEEEIERVHAALAVDGTELMPLDDYGFSRRFGWVNDRFGVSWQLNLA